MFRRVLLVFSLYLFLCQLSAQEIAQWRGMNRDGEYHETGLLKSWPESGPEMLWHFDDLGDGHASAAITDDGVFTAGTTDGKGFVYRLSHDGKLRWKTNYGEEWIESWPGTRSTPLVYKGFVYMISGFGNLFCLDVAEGKVVWKTDVVNDLEGRNIQWGITENLLIDGDMIFCCVGGESNNVVAFNRMTGKIIWSSKAKGEASAYCSPIIIKLPSRNVFVTQTASSIIGLDASDGRLLWNVDWPNKYSVHANTPMFYHNELFCVSGYGKGCIMLKVSPDGTSVEEKWRNGSLDNRMEGFVRIQDRIYGSDDENKTWWCLNWEDGKELGSTKVTSRGNVITADGLLYCYGENGEVALAEPLPDGYKKISGFKVPYGQNQHWAHLVINKGQLYVRHGTSLMVYKIK